MNGFLAGVGEYGSARFLAVMQLPAVTMAVRRSIKRLETDATLGKRSNATEDKLRIAGSIRVDSQPKRNLRFLCCLL
jgi:hypothetical protein